MSKRGTEERCPWPLARTTKWRKGNTILYAICFVRYPNPLYPYHGTGARCVFCVHLFSVSTYFYPLDTLRSALASASRLRRLLPLARLRRVFLFLKPGVSVVHLNRHPPYTVFTALMLLLYVCLVLENFLYYASSTKIRS